MLGPESAAKQALEKRFERWLDESLADFVVPENAPRVFSYELDDDVLEFQRQEYLNESLFVPELWATYRLLVRLFQGPLNAPGPDQADLCFLPLFLPVFEASEFDLRGTISSLDLLNAGPRHVVASLWDGYPRPPSRRANPYSMQSLGHLLEPGGVDEAWSWIDERWHVLTLCGSIDVDPADVNMFPLVLPNDASTGERPLLYSFCGTTTYDSVPTDHIRGSNRRSAWQQLALLNRRDVFVGSPSDAKKRFGMATPFRTLPAMSRFTLCPAGWSRWSFRVYEALEAGSIPVILSDYSVMPFADQLDWDAFSLYLPEDALEEIDDVLRSLSPQRVADLAASAQRVRIDLGPTGLARMVSIALSNVSKGRSHG